MREKLLKFLSNHSCFLYEIDAGPEQCVRNALDDFFNTYQPERLNEKTCSEGFFPPPWNINDHPEKTEGWIAFQEAMRNDLDYYKMR